MTIEKIYNSNEISVRSLNLCRNNDLNSVTDLLDYFSKYNSFLDLRNCGRKSDEELTAVCKKYKKSFEDLETDDITPLDELISNLGRVQREVISSYIIVNTNNLSVRSKNGIKKYLDDNLKIKNFASKILLSNSFILANIPNIGAKCIPELQVYISEIIRFIQDVSLLSDQKEIIRLKNNFLIQRTFEIYDIPNEILDSESIFQLTNFLLDKNILFNQSHTDIFKSSVKIYLSSNVKTTGEVATEKKLTRERVRQIKKDCVNSLFEKLLFIKNFNDDIFRNYGVDISKSSIEINADLVNKINFKGKTDFSREFISYILSVYLSDGFFLIGHTEDILFPKYSNSRNRHSWKDFFIIDKQFVKFDFIAFADDIAERLTEKTKESYSFNFKSYISRFITDGDIEFITLTFPIAEKIVNAEFGLYLDRYDNITFERKTFKNAFEYPLEALEIIGKPTSVDCIFKKIKELYPDYDTSEQKVRIAMKRKDGFVPVGRNSVFGLKKWENELENFKGGTIRSITSEFLERFNTPKHISKITEYVLNYRPESNEKSIYYNLKIDESQTFVFFKNSQIGLISKKYSTDYEQLEKTDLRERNSWNERYEYLNNFLSVEKRLPLFNNGSNEELKLYRWLNVQKSKIKTKKLDKYKAELIRNIFVKFPAINAIRRMNSIEKYNELINFVTLHKKLPNVRIDGEEKLYQFFYKQRKLYEGNELNNDELQNFLIVNQILKN